MAKPTSLPEWNSGGANNVEPAGGKKALGWEVDEVPPSSTFNWWQKLVYEWTVWLDGFLGVSHTWTKGQTINGDASAMAGRGLVVEGTAASSESIAGVSDSGIAVLGDAQSGPGIKGVSVSGKGVWGISQSDVGVRGQSTGDVGGQFVGTNGVNATSTVGPVYTGTAASGQPVYYASHNSAAPPAEFHQAGAGAAVLAGSTGTGSPVEAVAELAGTPAVKATPATGDDVAVDARGHVSLDNGALPDKNDIYLEHLTRENIIAARATITPNNTDAPAYEGYALSDVTHDVAGPITVQLGPSMKAGATVVASVENATLLATPVLTTGIGSTVVIYLAYVSGGGGLTRANINTAGNPKVHVMVVGSSL